MKTPMMFLVLLFTVTLFSQTECFTAGIGNVGGKRQFNKVRFNVCYPRRLTVLQLLVLERRNIAEKWKFANSN